MYGKSARNSNEYLGMPPETFLKQACCNGLPFLCCFVTTANRILESQSICRNGTWLTSGNQVNEVTQEAKNLSAGGSRLLPLPEVSFQGSEYLSTHPSSEHRCEKELLLPCCFMHTI
jgi:hypothetical protein